MILFLGLPSYGGRDNTLPIIAACLNPHPFEKIIPYEHRSSLLAHTFNHLWAQALMARTTHGVTHFLMLHNDVIPLDPKWVSILYHEMQRVGGSVISAVSPIKDSRGLTSTALETYSVWAPRRLTMKEIVKMPETFTSEDLLVNTGMLLVDIRGEWVKDVFFTIRDGMMRNEEATNFIPTVEPEDWAFSRQVKKLGVKVYATTKVKLLHQGSFRYPNFGAWGSWDTDNGDGQKKLAPTA